MYRAAVDLSRATLNYLAGVIRRRRKAIRVPWRRLNAGRQALLVLVHLRKGEAFTELGAGFGVSTSTAWRYVEEAVALLAARSPKLTAALRKAGEDGLHLLRDAHRLRPGAIGCVPTGRTTRPSIAATA